MAKFETKFDVGDKVWVVHYGEVKELVIYSVKCWCSPTQCYVEYDDYDAENCFATLEEAQAECDRRNKE